MKTTSQNNENNSHYTVNNRRCQTFVYNTDEVSLEALLDPNFRPTATSQQPQQVYYERYCPPQRSLSSIAQPTHYERASFDPFADLPTTQAFSTLPTRRRHLAFNNSSIIHL
jgi:hypothetical protein